MPVGSEEVPHHHQFQSSWLLHLINKVEQGPSSVMGIFGQFLHLITFFCFVLFLVLLKVASHYVALYILGLNCVD